jgi:hypothetical protein
MKVWDFNFLDKFSKNSQQTSWKSVLWSATVPCGRTDGRRDRHGKANSRFFQILWTLLGTYLLRFFRAFSSVVRQMPGWNPQRRGTARTLPNFFVFLCIFCVVLCIVCFVTFPALFVCICVLNYCHRVATQLQLNIFHTISCNIHTDLSLACA